MKKVFIAFLLLFFSLIVSSLFSITRFKENLNADENPANTNSYPDDNYYNTQIPCYQFCSKYGRTEKDCNNINKNLRCSNDVNGAMAVPRCFYSNEKTCKSY
jgi:hypothetical protein